jgi:hypothetical protein
LPLTHRFRPSCFEIFRDLFMRVVAARFFLVGADTHLPCLQNNDAHASGLALLFLDQLV